MTSCVAELQKGTKKKQEISLCHFKMGRHPRLPILQTYET